MRTFTIAALAVGLAACGGNNSDDDGTVIDAPPGTIDGPRPDAYVPTTCTPVAGTPTLGTVTVASNLDMPVFATAPQNDPRLFILEKGTGNIKILKDGALLPTPFLTVDVASGISDLDDERGLLGLAFAPDYTSSGYFYVYFVNGNSDEEIDRFHVSAQPDVAEPTGTQVWTNNDFASNHNGGTLAFGPDGYLYFAVGDGGNAEDVPNNGQNTNVLFGKMNRIDVSTLPYTSPATNPFAGATAGADEIWDWGLRNPYRWSFDRQTGDMYIGDVGQYQWEEIDVEPAGTGNLNYGWRQVEGTHCFNPSSGCNMTGKTLPQFEYAHSGGACAVVGGYVYRGACMPDLQGTYFFADYCAHWVKSTVWNGTTITTPVDQAGLGAGGDIVAFGQDGYGELYIVREDTGIVQKIVAQ